MSLLGSSLYKFCFWPMEFTAPAEQFLRCNWKICAAIWVNMRWLLSLLRTFLSASSSFCTHTEVNESTAQHWNSKLCTQWTLTLSACCTPSYISERTALEIKLRIQPWCGATLAGYALQLITMAEHLSSFGSPSAHFRLPLCSVGQHV